MQLQQLLRMNNVHYFTEDGSLNWNGTIQTSAALATYIALMAAFLAGISPLEFALCSAVLMCTWLSFYSAASRPPAHYSEQMVDAVVPSLSESMAELHSLQGEISALQAQFSFQTKKRPIAPDDNTE